MATRIFVARDNQNGLLVKNPAPPCQSPANELFYKEQMDEFINIRGGSITVYELVPVTTQKSIV